MMNSSNHIFSTLHGQRNTQAEISLRQRGLVGVRTNWKNKERLLSANCNGYLIKRKETAKYKHQQKNRALVNYNKGFKLFVLT